MLQIGTPPRGTRRRQPDERRASASEPCCRSGRLREVRAGGSPMSGAVIGVLALQGDVREHLMTLGGLGVTARPVRRESELEGIDGIVIPGGESTTMSRLLDVFDLRTPLEKALTNGLPAFGSCAGMIMLAQTILDGREDQRPLGALPIAVRRNAFGRQVDSFETDLEVAGVEGGPVRAVF